MISSFSLRISLCCFLVIVCNLHPREIITGLNSESPTDTSRSWLLFVVYAYNLLCTVIDSDEDAGCFLDFLFSVHFCFEFMIVALLMPQNRQHCPSIISCPFTLILYLFIFRWYKTYYFAVFYRSFYAATSPSAKPASALCFR